jgi:hypothetical protein
MSPFHIDIASPGDIAGNNPETSSNVNNPLLSPDSREAGNEGIAFTEVASTSNNNVIDVEPTATPVRELRQKQGNEWLNSPQGKHKGVKDDGGLDLELDYSTQCYMQVYIGKLRKPKKEMRQPIRGKSAVATSHMIRRGESKQKEGNIPWNS